VPPIAVPLLVSSPLRTVAEDDDDDSDRELVEDQQSSDEEGDEGDGNADNQDEEDADTQDMEDADNQGNVHALMPPWSKTRRDAERSKWSTFEYPVSALMPPWRASICQNFCHRASGNHVTGV